MTANTVAQAGTATKNNAALQARKDAAFARGMGNIAPVYVECARNAEIAAVLLDAGEALDLVMPLVSLDATAQGVRG